MSDPSKSSSSCDSMTTLSEQQNEESPNISPNKLKKTFTDDYDISPGKNRFKLNKIKVEKLSDDDGYVYASPTKNKQSIANPDY